MENNLEYDIRNLAYHIWLTAGSDFSRTALDFWVMAEQMIIELTADSARRANTAATAVAENAAVWPSALRALYLYRIRELAHNMWSASAEQQERSMDYWLAAEKHIRLLTETAARTTGANFGAEDVLIRTFETFSPAGYLEKIRNNAYQLWEAAGRQYGSALDFWLAAEAKLLESLTENGPSPVSPTPSSSGNTKRDSTKR